MGKLTSQVPTVGPLAKKRSLDSKGPRVTWRICHESHIPPPPFFFQNGRINFIIPKVEKKFLPILQVDQMNMMDFFLDDF